MEQSQIKPTAKTEPSSFHRVDSRDHCFVCGTKAVEYESDYPSLVDPFASQKILYCTECGSGYVPGSAQLLENYYKVDYATLNRGDRDAEPNVYFSDEYRAKSKKISRYFNRGNRHAETLKAFGVPMNDILDYGSGPGYFLYLSGAKNKFAFEPDTKSEKYLRYIKAKRFDNLDAVSSVQYDGIVASHSIEHLVPEELQKTLSRLISSLKPEGKILVEVPHGGHSFVHLDARQDPHTIFFTPEGIVRAIKRAGGRVLYHAPAAVSQPPARSNPIYNPTGHPFFSERRGSLVVVAEKLRQIPPSRTSWISELLRRKK